MKVFLSELAEKKLLKLNSYLIENWSLKVRDSFITSLTKKINQITKHPDSCPKSTEFKNLYKCVLSSHTSFYYRVNQEKKEIEIITFFDNRQKPNKLFKELK